jgi:hypothetical protein
VSGGKTFQVLKFGGIDMVSILEEEKKIRYTRECEISDESKQAMLIQGVYFLERNSQIVYVGKTTNVRNRLNGHLREKEFTKMYFLSLCELFESITADFGDSAEMDKIFYVKGKEFVNKFIAFVEAFFIYELNPVLNTIHPYVTQNKFICFETLKAIFKNDKKLIFKMEYNILGIQEKSS